MDFDPCADGVAVALRSNEFESQPMVAEFLIVAKEQRRTIDLRKHDVEVAVAINVGKCRTSSDNGLKDVCAAFFGRHHEKAILTGAFCVPKELRGLAVLLACLNLVNF